MDALRMLLVRLEREMEDMETENAELKAQLTECRGSETRPAEEAVRPTVRSRRRARPDTRERIPASSPQTPN